MALLEDWNWWAPAPLRRLHVRLHVDEGESGNASAHRPLAKDMLGAAMDLRLRSDL
jgi:hypothetical protein